MEKPTIIKLCEKIINLILLAMIFGIILGFNLITYDSCFIKITVLQVGATLAFGLWLIKLLEEKRMGLKSTASFNEQNFKFKLFFSLPFVVFFMWGIYSFLISPYKGVGLEELIKLFCYIAIYFVVINNVGEKQFKGIMDSLLIACFIVVFYGFAQYLGLDPFIWRDAFSKRIFSTFGNPNFFGAYLVLTAPLILTIFLTSTHWEKSKKYIFLLFFIALVLCLLFAESKGAWLGFAGEMIIFSFLTIIFLGHAEKKKIKKFLIILSTFIILVTATGVTILTNKRPDSIMFRLLTWRSSFQILKGHPVRGNGLNSFRVIYPLYRHREIFRIEGRHQTETQHPENEFVEIATDEGIVGLGIFIWMLTTFFAYGSKKLKILKEQSKIVDSYTQKSTDKQNKRKKELHSSVSLRSKTEYQLSLLISLVAGLLGLLIQNFFCVNMRFVSSGFFFWLFLGLINLQILGYPRFRLGEENSRLYKPLEQEKIYPIDSSVVLSKGVYSKGFYRIIQFFVGYAVTFLIIIFIRFYLADVHHNRGIGYSRSRMWDLAIKEYQKVNHLNPYFTMAHYFMGNVYNDRWENGDDQKAIAKYDDVKKLAPNYVMVHYQRGVVYSKLGKWDKAIEDFKKALSLDPVYALTYFRIGLAYAQLEQWDKSLEAFYKSIEIQPDFFDAYMNIGFVYHRLGNWANSEEWFRKAAELDPQNVNTHMNLGKIYAQLKKFSAAIEEWEKVLKIDSTNQEAQDLLRKLKH